jgi:ribonuclease D
MDKPHEHLVVTADDLHTCCSHLARCETFGFDTEFVGENSYHPELCLLQVATPSTLYLIDPLALDSLDPFWDLVVDPGRTVVVHAGREEVRLCHIACGKTPTNLVDLQIAAGMVGLPYPLGHGPLIQHVLGKRISKGETLTEWRTRPLTPAQIRYAFDDVRYLLAVWHKLRDKLHKLERMEWARQEFARLIDAATPDASDTDNVGEKWRRLKGCGALDRRKLAVARELFIWREHKAAELNRPARVLVRDDLLVEIARRNPRHARELAVVRGLAHRFLDEIFEAIQRARALPNDRLPEAMERDFDPPQVGVAVSLLQVALADLASRRELAPNLIATNADLKAIVRAAWAGDVRQADSLLLSGWREHAVLPELLAILEGKRWLRLADLKSSTPLEYQ